MNSTQRDKEHGDKTGGRQGYDEHVPGNHSHKNRARGNLPYGSDQAYGDDRAPANGAYQAGTYGAGAYDDEEYAGKGGSGPGAGIFSGGVDDEGVGKNGRPANGRRRASTWDMESQWGKGGGASSKGLLHTSMWRRVGLVLLGMLLVGGMLAAFSLPSIEAALTLPAVRKGPPVLVKPTGATTKTGAVTVPAKTAPPTAPAMAPPLAQDTFQRPAQPAWGTASDGQRWGGDATNANVFSINGDSGQIANGQGALNAMLGPVVTDAEVLFSGSISRFRQSNLGAVLRWTDTNNWYKAYLDGSRLILLRDMAAMQNRLAATPFVAMAGTSYTLRFRIIGNNLAAKAWQTGSPEPANWMVTAMDDTFQNGFGGLRLFMEQGIVAKITAFKETKAMG